MNMEQMAIFAAQKGREEQELGTADHMLMTNFFLSIMGFSFGILFYLVRNLSCCLWNIISVLHVVWKERRGN